MRQVLNGIYLGHINYSDSSLIGRFYTQQYGKRSFLIKGIKTSKNKTIGLLQPLNELEISGNFNPNTELNTCYTLSSSNLRNNIYLDIRKSTIAIFISEVLNKTIVEEEANFPLYRFIMGNINELDQSPFNANFHINFLIEMSLFLGFYPRLSNRPSDTVFNLEEGIFENESLSSPMHLTPFISKIFDKVLREGMSGTNLNNIDRFELLDGLIRYFEIQLGLTKNAFKSHQILKTVFS